jgi:hypothetical protein
MHKQAMPRSADAVHALLSPLPHEDPPSLEARGQPSFLQGLQLGHRARVLEILRLVP